jgi:hypothetical protein
MRLTRFVGNCCAKLSTMAIRHRLDVVVQLRERAEKQALEELGGAVQHTHQCLEALEQAQLRARMDGRGPGTVEQWLLDEVAHRRAVEEVERCTEQLEIARRAEAASRALHLDAYKAAEVIRRLAETRKRELTEAAEKKEAKTLDEIASQRHFRGR